MLCHNGKHSARYCHVYLGTYTKTWLPKSNPSPPRGREIRANPVRVGTSFASVVPSQRQQPQLQQQHQQHILMEEKSQALMEGLEKMNKELLNMAQRQAEKYESLMDTISQMMQQQQALMSMFMLMMKQSTHNKHSSITIHGADNDDVLPHVVNSTNTSSSNQNSSSNSKSINPISQTLLTSMFKPTGNTTQQTPQRDISSDEAYSRLLATEPHTPIDDDEIDFSDTPTASSNYGRKRSKPSSPTKPNNNTRARRQ